MTAFARPSGRAVNDLRTVTLETNVTRYAEGSCLAKFGHTHVLCTASWTDKVPGWMRGSGKGWVTGEYGMLPRATHTRGNREAARGKQSGRTQEIQRLIGRSLRSVVDLEALGENQITIDCDVIQADGGTRTASITGGYVALAMACRYLITEGVITENPIQKQAAAISVGLFKDTPVLDLDYPEDSGGEGDMNVVMSSDGGFIEVQGTGEERPMTRAELATMLELAEKGCSELFEMQRAALEG
ncbi:MAG: ribonuclease PH [Pseudomonadota bacterium]